MSIEEIICNTYELQTNNGVKYKIICGSEEIDKLIELIGEKQITSVEEL